MQRQSVGCHGGEELGVELNAQEAKVRPAERRGDEKRSDLGWMVPVDDDGGMSEDLLAPGG